MVAWKKTLTIPSHWKIDHRYGLPPLHGENAVFLQISIQIQIYSIQSVYLVESGGGKVGEEEDEKYLTWNEFKVHLGKEPEFTDWRKLSLLPTSAEGR